MVTKPTMLCDLNMLSAKDAEIREKAIDLDAIIVTKDREIFLIGLVWTVEHCTQVLWLHFPNDEDIAVLRHFASLR